MWVHHLPPPLLQGRRVCLPPSFPLANNARSARQRSARALAGDLSADPASPDPRGEDPSDDTAWIHEVRAEERRRIRDRSSTFLPTEETVFDCLHFFAR